MYVFFSSRTGITKYFKTKLHTNALSHPSLRRLHAFLERFFRELCRRGLFDVFHVSETGLLEDFLKIGEQEKVTLDLEGRIGRLLQYSDVLLAQELLGAQGTVRRCKKPQEKTQLQRIPVESL